MFHPRMRRASLALAATISAAIVLSPVAMAAPGDLPDLEQSAPANISGGYFDDHSIGGDNHLGWGYGTSDPRAAGDPAAVDGPQRGRRCARAVRLHRRRWLDARLPDDRRRRDLRGCCTGDAGRSAGSATPTTNHSSAGDFNRWHAMDVQRFALVPLPARSAARPAVPRRSGTPTGARA